MPGYDGTGPAGLGPFTGGGRGYCAIAFPESRAPYGYVGLGGTPVRLAAPLFPLSYPRWGWRMGPWGGRRGRWYRFARWRW